MAIFTSDIVSHYIQTMYCMYIILNFLLNLCKVFFRQKDTGLLAKWTINSNSFFVNSILFFLIFVTHIFVGGKKKKNQLTVM